MELTVNLFSKGLQMDTHPMVQGNDSLSDALNATFVTMNGNEVILQNDMGNRRVDNAFLPPGYQPVGMKEYGGIIYVAAYNPITNKSQIGSFPSPEKKIDENDDEDLGGKFDFDIFLDSNGGNIVPDTYLGINVLNTDSFLIPLTGDKSLRAGDKFAVFSLNLSSILYLLTNYNNTKGNKAESPKNRKYTLQLGVLNSQNEFVDITKTLCRWEKKPGGKWKPKKYDYSYSDVYKFNDGYFISDDFSNLDLSETIKDSNLIKSRLRIATNTYAYKLIGPLYLKASLNHPYNFNYSIYGTYDGGEANLKIVGYLTYNCPDNPEPGSIADNSNLDYSTFDEGRPRFTGFDLIGQTALNDKKSVSTYNSNNNLYSVKITKEYIGIQANPIYGNEGLDFGQTETTYNYTIGVLADIDTPDIYLRGLSVRGSIDLALLGSGKVFLTGWRFYNDVEAKRTYLFYSFNSYPKEGKHFDNLVFKFVDVLDSTNYFTYPREGGVELTNGTVVLDWDEYNIQPRTLYSVTATYDYADDDSDNGAENRTLEDVKRWFLSTPLFNDFYQTSEKVPDFCDPTKADLSKPEFALAQEKFLDLMKIDFKGSADYNSSFDEEPEEFEGGLIQKDDPNISYVCTHKIKIDLLNRSTITINNEDYYPKGITINSSAASNLKMVNVDSVLIGETRLTSNNLSELTIAFLNEIAKFSDNKKYYFEGKINSDVDSNFNDECYELLKNNLRIEGNEIKGEIIYKDVYKAKSNQTCNKLENVFEDFYNSVDEDTAPDNHNFGIMIDWNHISGGSDEKMSLKVETKRNNHIAFIDINNNSEQLNETILWRDGDHLAVEGISLKNYEQSLFNSFNNWIKNNKSLLFSYIFIEPKNSGLARANYFNDRFNNGLEGRGSKNNDSFIKRTNGEIAYDAKEYARVWWRCVDNNGEEVWAIFPRLIHKNTNLKDFIKDYLNGFIYCKYKEYYLESEENLTIYVAPSPSLNSNGYFKHTIQYKNIPYKLEIKYLLIGNNSEVVDIDPRLNINGSNLNFSIGNFGQNSGNIISMSLSSSTNFHDNINKINSENSLKNIYIIRNNSDIIADIKQLPDNITRENILYKDLNNSNKIYRINNPNFKIKEVEGNNKNLLLCKCDNRTSLVKDNETGYPITKSINITNYYSYQDGSKNVVPIYNTEDLEFVFLQNDLYNGRGGDSNAGDSSYIFVYDCMYLVSNNIDTTDNILFNNIIKLN